MKKRRLIHLYLTEDDNYGEVKQYIDSQLIDDESTDTWIYLLNKSYFELCDNSKEIFEEIIEEYKERDLIQEVLIIEKAEYIDSQYTKELKKIGIKNVELKAYSSNSYILSQVEEGSFKNIVQASKRLNFRRMKVFIEMQIGLPESNELDELQTARAIAKLKPYSVKIRPTLVFKDTILEDKYNNIDYRPLKLEEAIELTRKLILYFEKTKIPEIQIGFDEYDQLNTKLVKEKQDKSLRISQTPMFIDGPYTDDFNFFVYSSVYYEKILDIVKKYNMKVKRIEVEVNPTIAKFIAGHSNENLNNFKKIYDIETILKQSLKMPRKEIKVRILESYTDFQDG